MRWREVGVSTEFCEKSKPEKSRQTRPSRTQQRRKTKTSRNKSPNSQTRNHRRNHIISTASHERLKLGHRQPSHRLVDVDVKADGARIEVLKVVETGVANGLHLDGDGLASAEGSLVDMVRVAGSYLLGAEHLVNLGLGLVSGALGTGRLEDAEFDLAGAGEGESRGLELRLLGE